MHILPVPDCAQPRVPTVFSRPEVVICALVFWPDRLEIDLEAIRTLSRWVEGSTPASRTPRSGHSHHVTSLHATTVASTIVNQFAAAPTTASCCISRPQFSFHNLIFSGNHCRRSEFLFSLFNFFQRPLSSTSMSRII